MPSITHADRAMMLGGMKANAPEQFKKLLVMAEKYLPAEEFGALKESMK